MKILNAHIAKNLLFATFMALAILTFVMLSGQFFRAFDLVSRGVSPAILGQFLFYLVPNMLRFTLPLAMLVATVLVFSRMSADNEIVAMKAVGISLFQTIAPALLLSFLLCGLCLWLSLVVAPRFRYQADQLRWSAAANSPLAMLEAGTFTEIFPNCLMRIGQQNQGELHDIHIIMLDESGQQVQDITARQGRINVNQEERIIELTLQQATVTDMTIDGTQDPSALRHLNAESIRIPFDYGAAQDQKKLTRKLKYLDLKMLFARISLDSEAGQDVTEHLVELHSRLSMSIAPFSFLLIGLPFGIRSRRSELSVGILLCVLLALGFYAFLLCGDALKDQPRFHPTLIIWLPNFLYQAAGLVALRIMR
ncbi:MAG: YjgP/YjgQ family permease [Lentisphaerae bacterium]|nr:YjgP/YjgQ family permease [Lentisphaerota bacterium]